jgi:hypothetical protein
VLSVSNWVEIFLHGTSAALVIMVDFTELMQSLCHLHYGFITPH